MAIPGLAGRLVHWDRGQSRWPCYAVGLPAMMGSRLCPVQYPSDTSGR